MGRAALTSSAGDRRLTSGLSDQFRYQNAVDRTLQEDNPRAFQIASLSREKNRARGYAHTHTRCLLLRFSGLWAAPSVRTTNAFPK